MKCNQCGSEMNHELQTKPGKINNDDLLCKLFHGDPLTHDEIADIFGVSRVAVTNRVKKLGLERVMRTAEDYEREFGDELMNKIQLIMGQITADKINQASLNQLGTLLGILYDKRTAHERKGAPEVSYVGVLHKFDPASMEQLKNVMAKETARRLEESRKAQIENIK